MPDLEAKRTLVKSPPELWEELSEVDRLAKHLGAFGDIKITKLEPEHRVAWEGEHASGNVSIEPSGWGTKVTLTAELSEADGPSPSDPVPGPPPASPAAPEAPTGAVAGADPAAEPDSPAEPDSRAEPDCPAEPETPASRQEPERPPLYVLPSKPTRRGFWVRLFGRRRARTEDRAREEEPAADGLPAADGPREEDPTPEHIPDQPVPEMRLNTLRENTPGFVDNLDEDAASAGEEQAPVERGADEQAPVEGGGEEQAFAEGGAEPATCVIDAEAARAVLDGTLDALGSAHHRPFSRA
jgi:hypothetical protein